MGDGLPSSPAVDCASSTPEARVSTASTNPPISVRHLASRERSCGLPVPMRSSWRNSISSNDAPRQRGCRSPANDDTVPRFPRAPADLYLSADGRATWVEDNLLWRAAFDSRTGLTDAPVQISSDAAVEARHAADGSILYLSVDGLRLRAPNGVVRSISWPLRYRAASAPAPLLIRGARVIDGRGSPLTEPRDILVEGGRIARVASLGTIQTTGVRIIDATDKYLIPGLIDLHAHIWDDLSLLSWLHNGVTTIRDIASQRLKTPDTRNSIAAGIRPGPRIAYGGAMFHRAGAGYSTLTDQTTRDPASLARRGGDHGRDGRHLPQGTRIL